MKPCIM